MVALGRSPNGGSHGPPARPGATTFPTASAPTVRPARILVSTLPTVRQLTKTLPNARQPSSAIADIISRIPRETLQARSLSRAVWGITVRPASNRDAIPPTIERIARSFFPFFRRNFSRAVHGATDAYACGSVVSRSHWIGGIYVSFVTTLNVDVADWMASDFPTSSHPS
jgi:hypothetical protein